MEGVWHQVTQGGLCMDGRMDEGEAERLFPDPGVWKVSPSDAHPVSLTCPGWWPGARTPSSFFHPKSPSQRSGETRSLKRLVATPLSGGRIGGGWLGKGD